LDLIDQGRTWEVPVLPVVADSFDGNDLGCRPSLRQGPLPDVVEVESSTGCVDRRSKRAVATPQKTGRPRQYPPLEALPRPKSLKTVAPELPPRPWKHVTWREGSRGPQRAQFSLIQVWAAHGWREQYHPQRVAAWLLVKWPQGASEPVKDWLAHFEAPLPGLRRVGRIATSRWRIELDDRERKAELGLDHDEGRHWLGWHHHGCGVSIASALLRAEPARVKKHSSCDLAPGEEAPASPAHEACRMVPLVPITVR
jgi:hypothetical protein